MATTTRDPYNLSYAEDTQGTFGSGWKPGEGTAEQRAARAVTNRSAVPAQQKALKPEAPAIAPAAPVRTAPATALAPVKTSGSPLDVLSGFAPTAPGQNVSVAGARPQLNTDITSPGAVFPQQPTGAERAGAATRSAIGRGVDVLGRKELAAADVVTGGLKTAGAAAASPVAKGFQAVTGFTRGLLGRSTAAGATNASAAQFEQPTAKTGGRPVTPTSPQFNIDRSDQSLGKFGLSDAEFSRRKLAFAGF